MRLALLLLFLQLICMTCMSYEIPSPPPSDALALLSFKSSVDPHNNLPFITNTTTKTPFPHCHWPGIVCSPSGHVLRLVLESLALTGQVPDATLSSLDQLRVLSLNNNSLTGPIPDLSPLSNLKALFLAGNRFSGSFPLSVLSLDRLRTLDLSHNALSGPLPPWITECDTLAVLRLERNHFSSSIPAFNQSGLKVFNVSHNNFSGPVPVTVLLSSFDPSVFAGNPGLCGVLVRRECSSHFQFFRGGGGGVDGNAGNPTAPAPTSTEPVSAMRGGGGGGGVSGQRQGLLLPGSASEKVPKKMHKRAMVVIGVLSAGVLLIGVLGICLVVNKKRRNGNVEGSDSMEKGIGAASTTELSVETYAEEIENTNNELEAAAALALTEEKVKKLGRSGSLVFCAGETAVYSLEQLMRGSAEMLGRGSVGTTYKAVLDNGLVVTVKRLDGNKLGTMGKEGFEGHMDTVGRLRHSNLVPLRVFFQAKEERLLVYDYQPNGSLYSLIHGSRSTRAKPLHWTSCLKIAEDVAQGLAYIHQASRLVHGNIKSSNVLLGSEFEACLTDNCLSFLLEPLESEDNSDYRAPEIQKSNQRLTPRSDIYAYGVLLLELLTGRTPAQHPVLHTTDLPLWVRSVREDEGAEDERLLMMIDIAAACVRLSPESRPTTWQVLKMIQEVKEADAVDNDSD